jgi:hypothetical protein
MSLDPKSRAYDPTYKPTKSLEQLVAENPDNQFLADRLAEQRAAREKPSGMNSLRSNLLPIAVGRIIFLAVKIGLDSAGTILGIPSYIDYGYTVVVDHGLYDEDKGWLDYRLRLLWAIGWRNARLARVPYRKGALV